jgi:hypothetical protein
MQYTDLNHEDYTVHEIAADFKITLQRRPRKLTLTFQHSLS